MISDPVQDLTGDVLYDLYDFNGRQPGANIGYVRKNYTVTYNANLPNGASLISGVTLPDAQTFSTSGMVVRIKDLSGRNSYNRDAQVSGENKYYKFLGWAETSDATTAKYTPGQYFSVFRNTTLYAVWERNDKDVMYFVLMPGIDAPSNGADQGYQKYYPNKTDENDRNGDDGGVSGCTVYTGYTGGNLTATGFDAVPTEGNSVVDLAGQYSNSTYLSVPSNLGYFNANTKTEKLNLDMTGKEIVWYVIKNQEDGYHVDGYVKNVPIKVRYHENFNGDTDVKDTVTDIVSGETVTVKTAKAVFGEGYTHQGYTFAGWSTSQGEDGTVYQPGNQTEQLVTSLDLYAKWTKTDSKPDPDPDPTPKATDVYVYFKMVDAGGNPVDKAKFNNADLQKVVCNSNEAGHWATLGKISVSGTIADGTYGTGTTEIPQNVITAATTQLTGNALWKDNKDIANTVLGHIQWIQLAKANGAEDYKPSGANYWHLDGQITGYTVTYNKGTTEATNDVHNMPDADEMYYLSGSEYTVSDATPTRDGYVFTGWKYDENTTYQPEGKFSMPAKNVVLTAQWEKDTLVDPSVAMPEGITEGDGIADKYQIQVSFKAVNGTFKDGKNSITEYTTVVTKYTSGEPSENGTAKLANEHLKAENPDAGFTGPGSWKKGTDACEKPKADDSVQNGDHFVVTFEQEKESVANPIHYTINQHFIDAQKADKIKSTPEQATEVKTFGDSIPEEMLAVKQDFGDPKQNYVYVPAETTYKVGDQKKETTDNLANGAVIDLYYYLDVIGGKDEKGNLIDKGDEIPDCYQVTIIYKSSDERRGKISDASLKKEVLTIKDEEGNRLSSGKVEITGASAEVTGSSCYFSSWTNDAKVETSTAGATLGKQTIKNAKGGDVYTFTANFDRSSGGGSGGSNRPKPPVVEIPDDVPTGLNGKDHYAYIIGYGNNDVRPQNNITRAEVATIFFRLLTDETREANMTKSNGYNDVKDGDWFCYAVSTLSKMGIIKGYEDGSFKPNDPISRAEFAAIAARFDPDGDKTPASFFDVTSHWAKDEISIAANHGWIKGYEDGSFKPDQKITRAETMTLVNRVLNRLPETKDDLHKDMKTWVDNMDETAWYYLAVQEATNSHYFKNKTGTKFEQWTDLRDTRDWSELEK